MKAINASKAKIIATNIKEARSFFSRLKGLIGRAAWQDDEGLWMVHCRAIHTIGMRFPIDVVFLDRDYRVTKVIKSVGPYRPLLLCLRAEGVLELPAGTIEKSCIQVGDQIELFSCSE